VATLTSRGRVAERHQLLDRKAAQCPVQFMRRMTLVSPRGEHHRVAAYEGGSTWGDVADCGIVPRLLRRVGGMQWVQGFPATIGPA